MFRRSDPGGFTVNPDLAIIGAGPAGISAAVEARRRGLSVLVLDENAAPGGRIWQALERRQPADRDDVRALETIASFRRCGADARFGATVWAIEPDATIFWTESARAHSVTAHCLLVATGTTERPLPIPGWTLPGVMTIGAAQIALKTAGLAIDGATWLAGQGPLLLLYANQVLKAGGRIAGIIDLSSSGGWRRATPLLPPALRAPAQLLKGLAWRRAVARARVPWIRAANLRAQGDDALTHVSFEADGQTRTEAADLLLLHDGVIPSVHLTRALGCSHEWNQAQRCWQPQTDPWGRTSRPNVFAAGDGTGVAGAMAATLSGRIAALEIAHSLGRISAETRDRAAAPLRAERARHLSIRPLLDALYQPLPVHPDDDTIICRCEEVPAREITAAARLGCLGLNQLKAFTRCGMGPCQGRMCGPTAAELLARQRGVPVQDIEPYRARFPIKPVKLGELAMLATD